MTTQGIPDDLRPVNVNARLIYVGGNCAFFTLHDVHEVWGDDFDDAPYEHNAGTPYKEYVAEVLHFHSDLWVPSEFAGINSPWSVRDINKGLTPWLQTGRYEEGNVRIYAGTPLWRFVQLIEQSGGTVYLPRTITWADVDNAAQAADTNGGGRVESTTVDGVAPTQPL